VKFDGIKTRFSRPLRRRAESGDCFFDFLKSHLSRRPQKTKNVARYCRGSNGYFLLHARVALPAAMMKLHGDFAAFGMHRVSHLAQTRNKLVVPYSQ